MKRSHKKIIISSVVALGLLVAAIVAGYLLLRNRIHLPKSEKVRDLTCRQLSLPDMAEYEGDVRINYRNMFHIYIPKAVEGISTNSSIMNIRVDSGKVGLEFIKISGVFLKEEGGSDIDFDRVFYEFMCGEEEVVKSLKKKHSDIAEWVGYIKHNAFNIGVMEYKDLRVFVIGERHSPFRHAMVFGLNRKFYQFDGNDNSYVKVSAHFFNMDKIMHILRSIKQLDHVELIE